jgi:NAD(P)H-dependent flavin oxidoreductase YrpB (nitropropane dioxygenase family)
LRHGQRRRLRARYGFDSPHVAPLVKGVRGRELFETGDLEHEVWSAGMVIGLIEDIPTCKELVERIVAEAESIIRERLNALL